MSNNEENSRPQDGAQSEQNTQSQNPQPQPVSEAQPTSPNHASPISETTYERFDGAENTDDWVSFD